MSRNESFDASINEAAAWKKAREGGELNARKRQQYERVPGGQRYISRIGARSSAALALAQQPHSGGESDSGSRTATTWQHQLWTRGWPACADASMGDGRGGYGLGRGRLDGEDDWWTACGWRGEGWPT